MNMNVMALWKKRMLAAALSVSLLAVATPAAAKEDVKTADEIRSLIESYHVSGTPKEQLQGKTVDEMLKQLNDPYTHHITVEQVQQYERNLEDQYVGIGVRIRVEEQGLYITEVFPDSPALASGLLKGDFIVEAQGDSLIGLPIREATDLIRGPEGSEVTIVVRRDGASLTTVLKRKAVAIPPVYAYKFRNGAGYVTVSSFTSDADELFESKLTELQKQGIRSLIIDLRGNPGGYLQTVQNMAKLFLKEGVLMHHRNRSLMTEAIGISGGRELPVPVYVLVDGDSASASEVFAGMMQDYKLATVIGTKTYGKGSVQTFFQMSDGSLLRITIEEYLTPKFRKVNGVGLLPDVEIEGMFPQLFKAMKMAGENEIDVVLQERDDLFNGVDLQIDIPFMRQDEHVFVPSRFLAAMVGTSIGWNEELGAVVLKRTDGNLLNVKPSPDSLIVEDGQSFMSVDFFAKYFPAFKWESKEGKIWMKAS